MEYHYSCFGEIASVVVDPDNYLRLREALGWRSLMQNWLNGEIPEETLGNPHTFCEKLLTGLVQFQDMNPDDLMVVIARDITVFPLLYSIFGKTLTSLEFLNGLVIPGGSPACEILYAGANHSLKAEWITP